MARDPEDMTRHLRALTHDPELARSLAASGLERIRSRHTCAHRVDELLAILEELEPDLPAREAPASPAEAATA